MSRALQEENEHKEQEVVERLEVARTLRRLGGGGAFVDEVSKGQEEEEGEVDQEEDVLPEPVDDGAEG